MKGLKSGVKGMKNRNTPIILSDSIKEVRGGLTRAMFIRANTLAKNYGRVILLTFMYQQDHKDIVQGLYDKGLLHENVEVHNMFEDLANNEKFRKKDKRRLAVKEKGLIEFKDKKKKKKPAYRYYKNGHFVMFKQFDEQGYLKFIDYMNEARYRTVREEFSKDGYVIRSRHMDLILNRSRMDRYFDRRGNCYLLAFVNPENMKIGRVTFFGKKSKEFMSLEPVKRRWVEHRIKDIVNPVVMTDARALDPLSVKLKHDNVKRISLYHSNHHKNNSSDYRDGYKTSLNNLQHFDKVVFLTEEQKQDIIHELGNHRNNEVIPHPAPQNEPKNIDDFDPYLAVTLARYNKQKRIDEGIRAFKYVVEQIPQAKYHIYGFGEEQDRLQELINKLDLQDNVILKGFASNSAVVYRSAACSILTSDFEGFGMVLTESMSCGTPPVTFNCKYGPSDIVRDNVDGYLISKGNKQEMADRIINIMTNEPLRKELSTNALDVYYRFSVDDYENNWINLMKFV